MTKLCIHIYQYFRSHRVTFWSMMVGVFLFCGYFASQIHLEEDLNKLFPVSRNEDGSTKLAFANLRIKDKTFLLFEGTEGISAERIAEVCDTFIDSLQARNTIYGEDGQLIDDVFYSLSEDLLPDVVDYFTGHFPVYIDTAFYTRIDSMLTV